ncbi:MAG: DUF2249 domain-containing protein [Thermoflexaceae bacterium]|nr:DUF2249 domain-containing protein [Thermoflexaceae bacterium]
MANIELDNRGLQPPEPMVRILSALSELDDDAELVALMDRDPLLLYPELERRGYAATLRPEQDWFVLTIRKIEAQ